MIFGRLALRACGSSCMWCYFGRFLVLHSSGLMFSFLWGQWGCRLHCFVPWWGPGVACWVVSFVLRVSAVASPAAWCLCRWVGWGVPGVVCGSGLGAFNYWTTLVPLITISHFSHQFVVLLFPQRSPTSDFV